MKWIVMQILISVIGIVLFLSALELELSDITTFILATIGLFLIFMGVTFKGLVKIFLKIL